jgi:hypothetical protein
MSSGQNSNVDLWELIYGNGSITMWNDDMVNATRICDAVGAKWNVFFEDEDEDTQSFLHELAKKNGRTSDLVQFDHSGPITVTWVEKSVANKLASWCSPRFAVKANGIIYRYMTGQMTTEDSNAAASLFLAHKKPTQERNKNEQDPTILLRIEKLKTAQERAKADQELAKADQEREKSAQERERTAQMQIMSTPSVTATA